MKDSGCKSSIAKNAIFNAFYKSLSIIFPIISAGYAARVLTPEGIGHNAVAQNNVSYFLIIALLGIYTYSIREVARCRGDREKLGKLFSEILIINAFLTTIAIIAFVLCFFVFDVFKDDPTLYLICGIVLCVNYINFDWYFQATEEYRYIAIRSFAIKLFSLIMLFVLVRDKDDIYMLALLNSFAICGHYALNVFYVRKMISFTTKGLDLKKHIKPLVLLALCGVSSELYSRMDISMLGIMKGESTVAYYTYAQRIVNLIVGFVIALTAVFLPRLSYYFANNKEEFNRLTKMGTDMMIFASFPICFGIVSISYPLIEVWLGFDYSEVIPCLILLAFIVPLKCIGDIVCYQVMICAGKEFVLMISYALTLTTNVIVNLLLIPGFGALGACIASLISEVLVFFFVLIFARKYQDYNIDLQNFVVVLISSIIMMISVVFVENMIAFPLYKLFIGIPVGMAVFTILNIIAGNSFLTKILLQRSKPQ